MGWKARDKFIANSSIFMDGYSTCCCHHHLFYLDLSTVGDELKILKSVKPIN